MDISHYVTLRWTMHWLDIYILQYDGHVALTALSHHMTVISFLW